MALIPTIPGLDVREPTSAAEVLSARRLHARCYIDEGYVKTDHLVNGLIEDPWVPFSSYVIAVDTEDDKIVGTARIIKPSVRGFPAFEFFPMLESAKRIFHNLDPNRCSEISALATPRNGLQNMAISAAIYGHVWRESVENHRAYMLAVLDERLFRILRRWFQFPFEQIGEARDYMGARTMPTAMYIPRTVEVLTAQNPDALRFFSGDISFAELDEVALDIRGVVPEHAPPVIDLSIKRAE